MKYRDSSDAEVTSDLETRVTMFLLGHHAYIRPRMVGFPSIKMWRPGQPCISNQSRSSRSGTSSDTQAAYSATRRIAAPRSLATIAFT